jgi:hypothetical protein
MPRRYRLPAGMRFTRFARAQQDGLQALMHLPGIKGVFDTVARDGHQSDGRGLVVWLSTMGWRPPGHQARPTRRRRQA